MLGHANVFSGFVHVCLCEQTFQTPETCVLTSWVMVMVSTEAPSNVQSVSKRRTRS